LSAALASLREALLLADAERTASGYSSEAREAVRALARAGAERARVAVRALDDGAAASALALFREAALLHLEACVRGTAREALPAPMDAAEVVARFRALPPRRPPPRGPAEVEAFLADVAEGAPAAPRGTAVEAETARALVRWLATLVEPRGVSELRFLRRLRTGAAGVLALALVVWAAGGLLGGENIALHKPVTVSGVHPNSGAKPGGLTDGVISGAPYGVHTNVGDASWAQVDLLRVYLIDKVKIYNRGDGFFEDGLPMTLQLSEDGATFIDVVTRTTSFGQTSPWVAKGRGRPARYVRIRAARGKYVALSELEVFGRPR
jgi:hypothetical protein